jgi:hypothetical protein
MSTLNTSFDYNKHMILHEEGTNNTDKDDVEYRKKRYNYLFSKKPHNKQAQYKIQYSILNKAYNQIKNEKDKETDIAQEKVNGIKDVLHILRQKKNQRKNRKI